MVEMIEKNDDLNECNGLLIIMNLGEDTQIPSEYEQTIMTLHADSIAKGFFVTHIFDDGVSPINGIMEEVSDQTIMCPASFSGRNKFDFSSDHEERIGEFKAMSTKLAKKYNLKLLRNTCVVAGLCKIAGEDTFLPPHEL